MDKFKLIIFTIIFNYFHFKAQTNSINVITCDSKNDENFLFNENFEQCIINECQEYPEISPGCIICKNKLNEYIENKKCQRCKYGYFKTREEKCVYCASELYGGPNCRGCEYQKDSNGMETDNIICKECPTGFHRDGANFLLSTKGKCYDCQINFLYPCTKCFFTNELKDIKCDTCDSGYYMTSEGLCVSFSSLVKRIPNCVLYYFEIKDIQFELEFDSDYEQVYNLLSENYDEILKDFFKDEIKEQINSTCTSCDYGYILTDNGSCEKLNTFNSIIKFLEKSFYDYYYFCDEYNEVSIAINGISISNLRYIGLEESRQILGDYINMKSCLSNSGEGGEDSPET